MLLITTAKVWHIVRRVGLQHWCHTLIRSPSSKTVRMLSSSSTVRLLCRARAQLVYQPSTAEKHHYQLKLGVADYACFLQQELQAQEKVADFLSEVS